MAYTMNDKQNAIKNELSDLKNKHTIATIGLLPTSPIPLLDTFNYGYLWGNAIMDIYYAYYNEINGFNGSTITSTGLTVATYNTATWENAFKQAISPSGDGATSNMWPFGSTIINTTSTSWLTSVNGMTSTVGSFPPGISSAAAAVVTACTIPTPSATTAVGVAPTALSWTLTNLSNYVFATAPTGANILVTGIVINTPPTVTTSGSAPNFKITNISGGTGTPSGSGGPVTFTGITPSFDIPNIQTLLASLTTAIDSTYGPYLTATKAIVTSYNADVSGGVWRGAIPTSDFDDVITLPATNYPAQLTTWTTTMVQADVATVKAYCTVGGTLSTGYQTRFATLLSYLGTTYTTALNKWRIFWINERINQGTGSLSQYQSLVNLQASMVTQIGTISTPNTKLYTVNLLFPGTVLMPGMNLLVAYFNPLVSELDGTITTNKSATLWDGRNHATSYTVYRKLISSSAGLNVILNDGSLTDWVSFDVGFPITINTYDSKGYILTNYEDSVVSPNTLYAYRIMMSDNSTPFVTTYTSLQSPSLDGNAQTVTFTTGALANFLYGTYPTAHGYSVGQTIYIKTGASYYLAQVAKVPTDKTIEIKSTDFSQFTIKDLFGTVISTGSYTTQLTFGVVKTSF